MKIIYITKSKNIDYPGKLDETKYFSSEKKAQKYANTVMKSFRDQEFKTVRKNVWELEQGAGLGAVWISVSSREVE